MLSTRLPALFRRHLLFYYYSVTTMIGANLPGKTIVIGAGRCIFDSTSRRTEWFY
jgi:hypothetical protein